MLNVWSSDKDLLQVQKWAPTADRKLNLQILIGFGSANVGIQWNGPQSEAEAALQSSGILSVPGIQAWLACDLNSAASQCTEILCVNMIPFPESLALHST